MIEGDPCTVHTGGENLRMLLIIQSNHIECIITNHHDHGAVAITIRVAYTSIHNTFWHSVVNLFNLLMKINTRDRCLERRLLLCRVRLHDGNRSTDKTTVRGL